MPVPFLTPEQYLAIDKRSERPSEYYDGEMFVIEAASPNHSQIQLNLGSVLREQLRASPCKARGSSIRVRIPGGPYTYPYMVATCGEREYEADGETLLNPTVVFEVLSPSTADFNLGRKFDWYRSIKSLLEYIVIEQNRRFARRYTRQPDRKWILEEFEGMDAVLLVSSLNCAVPFPELYLDVEFEPEP